MKGYREGKNDRVCVRERRKERERERERERKKRERKVRERERDLGRQSVGERDRGKE